VDYVAVVYQTVSNFGNAAHPALEARLQHLARLGLVDELRRQEPREFSDEEKHALCSPVSQVRCPVYSRAFRRENSREGGGEEGGAVLARLAGAPALQSSRPSTERAQ